VKNEIKGFTFYRSYYESLKNLKENDKKNIINAMLEYVFEDKKPNFRGIKKTIWTLIEPNLNTSKNRSNTSSGAPKGNKNACKEKQSKNNQITINDLYDKDKDKDKDKEGDISIEIPTSPTPVIEHAIFLFPNYDESDLEKKAKKFFKHYKEKNWKGVNSWKDKLEIWLDDDIEKGEIKEKEEEYIDEAGFRHVNGRRVF